MNKIEFDNFDIVVRKCKELAIFKNKQYGVKNLLIFQGFGILTRMNDKMARLNNLLEIKEIKFNIKEIKEIKFDVEQVKETIDDTLLDLINYTIYLYLYRNDMLLKKRGEINID